MKSQKKNILISAGVLGIGAFFVKFIGAIYRIPLTNILKCDGIGLYQMVFPVYALLLDFSGAGVPSALSKLIAESNENKEILSKKYLRVSLRFFGTVGLIFSLLLLCFSRGISNLQGNRDATLAYILLSPSVFLVCLISCYRGFFQGYGKMKPTAISQIIEQVVKVCVGLLLANLLIKKTPLAVGGATLAITISEICALVFLIFIFNKFIKKNKNAQPLGANCIGGQVVSVRKILKAVIPITLVGIITPFSQVIDSFLIVNLLKNTNRATSLYGIYSGVSLTVVNLPVSVCYGLAVTSVPTISSSKSEQEKAEKTRYLLRTTFCLSLLASVCVFLTSKPLVRVIFSSLKEEDRNLSVALIKLLSVMIIFLSLVQTQNSIFIARGKYYIPLIVMTFSVIVKSVLEIVLLKIESINIFGGAIALITCYFIAFLLNCILIKRCGERNASKNHTIIKHSNRK